MSGEIDVASVVGKASILWMALLPIIAMTANVSTGCAGVSQGSEMYIEPIEREFKQVTCCLNSLLPS